MQFWTHSMTEVFFRVYRHWIAIWNDYFLGLKSPMAVATCHEFANGNCNLPFGLKKLTAPLPSATCKKSGKAGLRMELASLTGGSHLQRISPVLLAICSCACAYRPCQWWFQSAAANPPVPLAVCLHHAWGYVQKCPLG